MWERGEEESRRGGEEETGETGKTGGKSDQRKKRRESERVPARGVNEFLIF